MAAVKLSAREAIFKVLKSASKPMPVTEIIKAGVPMTALKGATPGQTFYSVLYAEAKKKDGLFQKVSKGTFKLRSGATLDKKAPAKARTTSTSQAKPDPKKKTSPKRSTAKRASAKRSPAVASRARSRSTRSGRA